MTVVVGVDASPHAGVVLEKAIEEAELHEAELHVVHVFNPPVVYLEVPIDLVMVKDAELAAVWGAIEEKLARAPIDIIRTDLDGYPPDTLVAYAEDVGATLLVVGTRGRGELASLILGSTSSRAIHLAKCDVLVVKPPAG